MSEVEVLGDALTRYGRSLERQAGEARALAREGKEISQEVADLEALIQSLEEAIGVLNSYADIRQAELQRRIEGLVSRGLKAIFDEDLSFHIVQGSQGKLTAMEFVVRSEADGKILDTPIMDARGGGVAAVCGFLLRLVILLLKGDFRPVLFLDESFAQLSAEYEPRLAEFIRELVDRTPVQIVMVTHSDSYGESADLVYRFALKDGVTQISPE